VTLRLSLSRILFGLSALLLAFGFFILGFTSSRHLKAQRSDVRKTYLAQSGNANPAERSSVLAALTEFQEGYVKRNPQDLDAFMDRLFLKGDDVLLMGTDSGEWRRGYSAVAEFIKTDWTSWGDFRFAVDDSIVWCSGDVAWIVSIGTLRESGSERPLRFSAILTRRGNDWRFRQLHFQWDDSAPDDISLLHPRSYITLFKRILQSVRGTAHNGYEGFRQGRVAPWAAVLGMPANWRASESLIY
jgi:hypothetical protein